MGGRDGLYHRSWNKLPQQYGLSGAEADRDGDSAVGGKGAPCMFQMRREVKGLWILLHLLYLSAEDVKEHRISMPVILELGCTGMMHAAAEGRVPSLLPGCLVLFIAFFSKERIGYGDGWLILALGMWIDAAGLLRLFLGGVMLGFLYGLCFRKKELPLVPFLTAVYTMGEWM